MKLQYVFLGIAIAVIGIVTTAGLRGHFFAQPPFEIFPDMNYQDKVKDQQPSAFFADGNSAREPIPGTVAMEMPAPTTPEENYWSTGKWDDSHWGTGIPVHEARDGGRALAVDEENMARGRERFNISCSACHGVAGDGQGVVTKYGLSGVANFHDQRLIQASDGDIFNTISNGNGQMLGYGYNIAIDDRWRIVMYVRSLQRSQNAMLADATADEQTQLDKTKKPAAPAPAPTPASGPSPSTPPGPTTNPTVPPSAPAPAPPAPTNTPPVKPAGTAYLEKQFGSPRFTVPPWAINDSGMVYVEPTYFESFAPVTRSTTKP
jgi:mono/diheme cytochrome c family protein